MPWDVYKASCPTRQVLDCIANKWAVLVIGQLLRGRMRFGALRSSIEGISQKMLTQTLRAMERDGIIDRDVSSDVPPHVGYSLTPLGHSLGAIVDNLRQWSEINIEGILAHRTTFDRAAGRRLRKL